MNQAPRVDQAFTLVVIAKSPIPGRVKTRLCPPFDPSQAAALAAAALADTLEVVRATPATRRVLALDGPPGSWLPVGFELRAQCEGGLDERIAGALAGCTGPTLLVGMDTPQLTSRHLTVCFDEHDAWFGPAADGGFWGLGLRHPDPALVRGVRMSLSTTGAAMRARLIDAGLRVGELLVLRDIDTAADAAEVAALAPSTRFAETHRRLTTDLVPADLSAGDR